MAYSGTLWHIYVITNMVNGKKYVGLTNSLSKRWNKHKNANGSIPALHSAIKKYGVENFDFCHYADTFGSDAAKFIEINLIRDLGTLAPLGYNLTSGGEGTLNPSIELRSKLSISHKGKLQSEETKKKRSESLKKAYAEGRHSGNNGKTFIHTPETRIKLSKSKMGDKNPMFGVKHSVERKKQISENFIGNTYRSGNIVNAETKLKMSIAQKARWLAKKAIEQAQNSKDIA
jgi:group I intron endonuclease